MSNRSLAAACFGINLTQMFQGPDVASLALLGEINDFIGREVEDESPDDVAIYDEFEKRIEAALALRNIYTPTRMTYGDSFGIMRVPNDAEIYNGDPGDIILGLGLLAFPLRHDLPATFVRAAEWITWVVSG